MNAEPDDPADRNPQEHAGPGRQMTHGAFARDLIANRLSRATLFGNGLLSDPVWDMLLDLFQAHEHRMKIPVTSLCIASGVPTTTALRWLKVMEDQELCTRVPDPLDQRRSYVLINPSCHDMMRKHFDKTAERWGIALVQS